MPTFDIKKYLKIRGQLITGDIDKLSEEDLAEFARMDEQAKKKWNKSFNHKKWYQKLKKSNDY